MSPDKVFLGQAIDLSADIAARGGFPVGAIVVVDGEIVGRGVSDGKRHHDPTMHAEIDAIRQASARLQTRNLSNATLYSSMEPCLMCYSACYWARIDKVVFACGKDNLDSMHYEKSMSAAEVNDRILQKWQMQIVHDTEQQDRALQIVNDWEAATYGQKGKA